MQGRKTKQESREKELLEKLAQWQRMPKSSRPSLRALARELKTSHQLLVHYLARCEKRQYDELCRQKINEREEILARAKTENRDLTPWEYQQVLA
jgi:hypothetical protein